MPVSMGAELNCVLGQSMHSASSLMGLLSESPLRPSRYDCRRQALPSSELRTARAGLGIQATRNGENVLMRLWPAEPFARAVAIFFALVLLALGIAAVVNAPLCYDGAFYLFRLLDSHRFSAAHLRLINIPLQVPVLVATHLTQDLRVLRLTYCAAYASIPVVAMAVSWFVCKSHRPSLFIWPAMSICIAGLPGQLFFQSETIMAVTLLWPALLAVLVDAPAAVLPWVAVAAIGAVGSHPYAGLVLAPIVLVAIVSAISAARSHASGH